MSDPLAQPLRLPCGVVLANRLCKAAMTEGLGDARLRATARHERLYEAWSQGGAGLLVTGNVMVEPMTSTLRSPRWSARSNMVRTIVSAS